MLNVEQMMAATNDVMNQFIVSSAESDVEVLKTYCDWQGIFVAVQSAIDGISQTTYITDDAVKDGVPPIPETVHGPE